MIAVSKGGFHTNLAFSVSEPAIQIHQPLGMFGAGEIFKAGEGFARNTPEIDRKKQEDSIRVTDSRVASLEEILFLDQLTEDTIEAATITRIVLSQKYPYYFNSTVSFMSGFIPQFVNSIYTANTIRDASSKQLFIKQVLLIAPDYVFEINQQQSQVNENNPLQEADRLYQQTLYDNKVYLSHGNIVQENPIYTQKTFEPIPFRAYTNEQRHLVRGNNEYYSTEYRTKTPSYLSALNKIDAVKLHSLVLSLKADLQLATRIYDDKRSEIISGSISSNQHLVSEVYKLSSDLGLEGKAIAIYSITPKVSNLDQKTENPRIQFESEGNYRKEPISPSESILDLRQNISQSKPQQPSINLSPIDYQVHSLAETMDEIAQLHKIQPQQEIMPIVNYTSQQLQSQSKDPLYYEFKPNVEVKRIKGEEPYTPQAFNLRTIEVGLNTKLRDNIDIANIYLGKGKRIGYDEPRPNEISDNPAFNSSINLSPYEIKQQTVEVNPLKAESEPYTPQAFNLKPIQAVQNDAVQNAKSKDNLVGLYQHRQFSVEPEMDLTGFRLYKSPEMAYKKTKLPGITTKPVIYDQRPTTNKVVLLENMDYYFTLAKHFDDQPNIDIANIYLGKGKRIGYDEPRPNEISDNPAFNYTFNFYQIRNLVQTRDLTQQIENPRMQFESEGNYRKEPISPSESILDLGQYISQSKPQQPSINLSPIDYQVHSLAETMDEIAQLYKIQPHQEIKPIVNYPYQQLQLQPQDIIYYVSKQQTVDAKLENLAGVYPHQRLSQRLSVEPQMDSTGFKPYKSLENANYRQEPITPHELKDVVEQDLPQKVNYQFSSMLNIELSTIEPTNFTYAQQPIEYKAIMNPELPTQKNNVDVNKVSLNVDNGKNPYNNNLSNTNLGLEARETSFVYVVKNDAKSEADVKFALLELGNISIGNYQSATLIPAELLPIVTTDLNSREISHSLPINIGRLIVKDESSIDTKASSIIDSPTKISYQSDYNQIAKVEAQLERNLQQSTSGKKIYNGQVLERIVDDVEYTKEITKEELLKKGWIVGDDVEVKIREKYKTDKRDEEHGVVLESGTFKDGKTSQELSEYKLYSIISVNKSDALRYDVAYDSTQVYKTLRKVIGNNTKAVGYTQTGEIKKYDALFGSPENQVILQSNGDIGRIILEYGNTIDGKVHEGSLLVGKGEKITKMVREFAKEGGYSNEYVEKINIQDFDTFLKYQAELGIGLAVLKRRIGETRFSEFEFKHDKSTPLKELQDGDYELAIALVRHMPYDNNQPINRNHEQKNKNYLGMLISYFRDAFS